MVKKDAYYFSHDSNARHDPKIIKLRAKHGLEGYGFYFCLLEIMRESADYMIDIEDLETVSYQLNIQHEKAEEIVKTCIKTGLLKQEQSKLLSESFLNRMVEVDKKRKTYSENGKKGGRPKPKRNPNETQIKPKENLNESIKAKQSKEEKNKAKQSARARETAEPPAADAVLAACPADSCPAGGLLAAPQDDAMALECWEFFKALITKYSDGKRINIDKLSAKYDAKLDAGLLSEKNPKGILTTIAKKEWQQYIVI